MGKMVKTACIRCGKEVEQPLWRSKHKTAVKKTCSTYCAYKRRGTDMERFMAKVDKVANGCWLWTAATNQWGYPWLWINKKLVFAHRWGYEQHIGPVPKDKVLMHSCDTPSCVNPKHLRIGTLSDNSKDMMLKGRNGNTKLHVDQIREIAEALKGKPATTAMHARLAAKYGVSEQTIYLIHRGRTWRTVTGFPRQTRDGLPVILQGTPADE